MLLKEYLIDNCENEQLAIIIDNLADAAILISKKIGRASCRERV